MKARFSTSRRLHSLAEGSGPRGFAAHRPYSLALSVQAGEIVSFTLRSDRTTTDGPLAITDEKELH
jgi:hypothetical protein